MTTANKITILRILLIPFFVIEMIYYVRTGNENFRFAGLLSFAVAAILDGVDGYIARRYNCLLYTSVSFCANTVVTIQRFDNVTIQRFTKGSCFSRAILP